MSWPGEQITSIKDERVVEARQLASAAGRLKLHKCLLEGAEVIEWALANHWKIERVFFTPKWAGQSLMDRLATLGIECIATSEGILKKITDTSYLIPVVGVSGDILQSNLDNRLGDFVCVLDDVRDHGNIGTIVRTARAFQVNDIVSTDKEFDLYYRKIIEASRGSVFDVRLRRFESALVAIAYLRDRGFQIVATSPHADTLQSLACLKQQPVALVIGNETRGVSDEVLHAADLIVQIPMSPRVESLNVGVATGISIYELKLKLVMAMLTQYIRGTIGRNINVAGKLVQLALDVRLRSVSLLNGTQAILLMVLECDERMTLEQVGKDTGTFGAELEQMLKPLLDEGFVRFDDPDRRNSLMLTDKGEQFIGQTWSVVEAAEAEVLAGFTQEERGRLTDYLQRILDNCQRIIDRESL